MKRFLVNVLLFFTVAMVCSDGGMSFRDWHYWAVLALGIGISVFGFWEGVKEGAEINTDIFD